MQKRFVLIALCVMLFAVFAKAAVIQDTVSTSGIEFSPAPAAQQTTGTTDSSSGRATNVAAKVNKAEQKVSDKQNSHQAKQTLWAIFGAGFLGGLAALFMPCIFPMLPLTVSYFTKKAQSKSKAIRTAIFYGLSIIAIYVVLGLLITIVFGADALNSLATNGVFNMAFFLLLVVFAASFLGAFEITLPNSWVNKMDEKSDKSGFAGIFFMAATLSLVSFSCTGPIIGTLLVQAAVSGALLGPAVGMFGFSLALAIPFTLFATFPSLLQAMPKSGGWLNSVKVVLGFLELALALKFLSNVDLAYHWHWFDREVFLVLWIVIFALMGFYLLGKLRFSHDSELPYISVPRLFLAIIVLSFTTYMIPGLWGAPLKSISAFLPPQATQDFDLYTASLSGSSASTATQTDTVTRKYAKLFDKPAGQNPFFDYQQGLAYARAMHKPVMIDFTGHACVNCRKMEANVWTDKAVLPVIRDEYVLIQLYVDDKTELPAAEQYTSKFSGKLVRTIGALNSDIQASRFNSNSQPFYVLMDPSTEQPLAEPQGADYDAQSYLKYLNSGLTAFKSKAK
ncbi:thioredoxin family protein [Mucilaginibacter sp. RS28]|uniref:Thioredoxin family protein n=1 Tax=Mucilaginibacter straminoryzae TaxID=2932774 RepID=A0A9X2B861_9SPHI|nr:cytochrome c biogenesis protein CcdA [Mucilaginibacter straminoryzae]MCJ8208380.1 thioredoxin family protein [Mucilaginibacter straminoryzae]